MALTLSPYAPRFTQSSLSGSIAPDSPLRNNPMMSRTVSINMDGLGDYNDTTEHFDSLDTSDMVADFGDGMGVDMNFGHADDEKGALLPDAFDARSHATVVDSELSKSSAMLTPTSTQMQLDATQMQLNQAQAALGGSHHPRSVDDMFHSETGLEGGSDDEDGEYRARVSRTQPDARQTLPCHQKGGERRKTSQGASPMSTRRVASRVAARSGSSTLPTSLVGTSPSASARLES